ncbi:hypothetical protein PV341_43450, partial [Streptomyces sp. PA03-1a]|nr:hypothetical protein [Streptomyces sp. PA03-1a]
MTALAALLSTIAAPSVAHAADPDAPASRAAAHAAPAAHTLTLDDGSVLHWSDDGSGTLTRKDGTTRAFPVAGTKGRSAFGGSLTPSAEILQRRADAAALTPYSVGAAASARRRGSSPDGVMAPPTALRPSSPAPGKATVVRALRDQGTD